MSKLDHTPNDGEIIHYVVPGSNTTSTLVQQQLPSIVPFGSSPSGTMTIRLSSALSSSLLLSSSTSTSQKKHKQQYTTIEIHYNLYSGIQMSPYHINPGLSYHGTQRIAYILNNDDGQYILTRYMIAFAYGYMFTIGTSLANNLSNQITWSVIPHKTSLNGGIYGYPDQYYIANTNQILDSIGIPSSAACLLLYNKHIKQQQNYPNGTIPPSISNGVASLPPPIPVPIQNGVASLPPPIPVPIVASTSSSIVPRLVQQQNVNETIKYVAPKSLLSDKKHSSLDDVLDSLTKEEINSVISSQQQCPLCLDDLISSTSTTKTISEKKNHFFSRNNSSSSSNSSNNPQHQLRKIRHCHHIFHKDCIEDCLKHHPKCPTCRKPIYEPQGKSPSGTMKIQLDDTMDCPGYINANGTYIISYHIPSGTQHSYHDSPGTKYQGAQRTAYIPNTIEGYQLLQRLKYAWKHGLMFTIGTSLTNHMPHQTTWASIHHKTNLNYNYPSQQIAHSFPDDSYFYNVNESLDALHVPSYDEITASSSSS